MLVQVLKTFQLMGSFAKTHQLRKTYTMNEWVLISIVTNIDIFMLDRRLCGSQSPNKILPFIEAMFLEELTLQYAKEDWLLIYDSEVNAESIYSITPSIVSSIVDWCTWSCQHCVDDASLVHIYLLIKILTYFYFSWWLACATTQTPSVWVYYSLCLCAVLTVAVLLSLHLLVIHSIFFLCCLAWTYTYIIILFSLICGEYSLSMISWEALLFLPQMLDHMLKGRLCLKLNLFLLNLGI